MPRRSAPPAPRRAAPSVLNLSYVPQRKGSAPSRRKSAQRAVSANAAALMKQLVPHQDKEEPLPAGVRDIDAGEEDDPTLVSCYARPVYKHLMEVEVC